MYYLTVQSTTGVCTKAHTGDMPDSHTEYVTAVNNGSERVVWCE